MTELKAIIVGLQQYLSTANQQSSVTIDKYTEELASKDNRISAIHLLHSGEMQKKDMDLRRITLILRSDKKLNNQLLFERDQEIKHLKEEFDFLEKHKQ